MALEADRGEQEHGRRRARTRQFDDTRARILDAATRLFGENGYAATSTRAIATAVGVSPSAPYYAIGSKQDILVEIYNSYVDGWLEIMYALLDSELSPIEKLQQYVNVTLENIENNQAKMKIFTNEHRSLKGESLSMFEKKCTEVQSILPRIIQEGVSQGLWCAELAPAASIAMKATASWLVNRFGSESSIPAPDAAQAVLELVSIALTKESPSRP